MQAWVRSGTRSRPADGGALVRGGLRARQSARRAAARGLGAALTFCVALPAWAHHPLDGKTPETALEGLLSGFAHPVIGPDHLLFVLAVGLLCARSALRWIGPGLFALGTAGGCAALLLRLETGAGELAVALSLVSAGGVLLLRRALPSWWLASGLLCAGLAHGYAYGESIVGADRTALAAYLLGFVGIQIAVAAAVQESFRLAVRQQPVGALWCSRLLGASSAVAGVLLVAMGAVPAGATSAESEIQLGYREAGLSEAQAAAVLLERFSFGARPGEAERVQSLGLESWFAAQLDSALPENGLQPRLGAFPARELEGDAIARTYPSTSMLNAHARRFYPGVIPPRDEPVMDFAPVRRAREAFAEERGFRDAEGELVPQLVGLKLLRAVHAENQLRERLVDFWQNHFFAGTANFRSRPFVLSFEEHAVRPHVLGRFADLLRAATLHPALLEAYSHGEEVAALGAEQTTLAARTRELARGSEPERERSEALVAQARSEIEALDAERELILARESWAATGPNPVRARALLELHTLGPDGPQSERDVREAARVLSGWTPLPRGASDEWFTGDLEAALQLGFAREGGLFFRADQHDATEKELLGLRLPAGGGVEEGLRLIDHLAAHSATAQHVARSLAAHFAATEPPAALVEAMGESFRESRGDLRAVLRAMVASPAFWESAARRDQVKTPFELVTSAVRSLDGSVSDPASLAQWCARLGQPLYGYLEDDGEPEDGAYWLDPASLRGRIAYARALASGEIEGVALAPPVAAAAESEAGAPDWRRLAGPQFQLH